MNHKAFRQLLKRYLDNSCTDDERAIIDRWYELLDHGNTDLSKREMDETESRLWNKLQSAAKEKMSALPVKKRSIGWKYAAAACLLGVVLLAGILWFTNNKEAEKGSALVAAKLTEGFLEQRNTGNTPQQLKLEDGSVVTIYTGSRLVYPKHFTAAKREVYLEGEAFFAVSKNPNRPFFVYSNNIVTQVLGTSFDIRGRNGQLEVAVKTGRVAVYENKEQMGPDKMKQRSNGVIITPNQKVTYYQQEGHFVTSIVDQPVPVPKGAENTEIPGGYNETPLHKVLNDLETTYELEIVLENEKIRNCLFTGDLTGQSLFNKLETICLVFDATYEVKGTKILLKAAKDCPN
ncbi:FecR family protein [Longitalea arenae]|uniref:FecR family protein n=1 Tax=Longitalea arenae TaxID=2812558 RepID=UPI001967417C|nr:FecR family protein [Longitalea arenae]